MLSCKSLHSLIKSKHTTWQIWEAKLQTWLQTCNDHFNLASENDRRNYKNKRKNELFTDLIAPLVQVTILLSSKYISNTIRVFRFFFQLILWMLTLSLCLIWQIISFILPPNHYASLSGPAIELQQMTILEKKIIFSDEAHFDLGGYVNIQTCRIWNTENPH